jgi:hypothetical protein
MKSITFPLKPGEIDVEFRFTFRTARQLELSAGCNYQSLLARGQQVEAVAQMTCFALRHDDKAMTIDKAVDLIDAYIEKGGDIVKLYLALQEAMNHSGCYGPVPKDDAVDPTTPSAVAA